MHNTFEVKLNDVLVNMIFDLVSMGRYLTMIKRCSVPERIYYDRKKIILILKFK